MNPPLYRRLRAPLVGAMLWSSYRWREQQRRKGYDSNIIELGIRQIINPLTVVAVGAGAGLAEDSPAMRVAIGVQYSF